jgi:hypothetical protein
LDYYGQLAAAGFQPAGLQQAVLQQARIQQQAAIQQQAVLQQQTVPTVPSASLDENSNSFLSMIFNINFLGTIANRVKYFDKSERVGKFYCALFIFPMSIFL